MVRPQPNVARRTRSHLIFTILSAFVILAALLMPLEPLAVAAQGDDPTTNSGGPGAEGEIPYAGVNPFGTNVFLHKEAEQWKVTKTLEMVVGASIPWVKQDFTWSDIEIHAKGDFEDRRDPNNPKSAWAKYDYIVDEATRLNLNLVARVSFAPEWARAPGSGANDAPLRYEDLADFINALLDHYQERIKYVQVWNEPNLAYEWKLGSRVDPAGYTDLLKTVYTTVKAKHPNVAIISAPMAINLETIDYAGNLNELDYWDQMYKAGAADYFDILSANAYGLDLPPTDPPARDKLNFRRVELLRDVMVANGDENKAVWFNEYGWNASPTTIAMEQQLRWRRVEPEVQAQWTVDGINYAQEYWPWSGVFFIWYFRQVGDIEAENAEYYFRMVESDTFEPTQVYRSVKTAALAYAQAEGTPTPAGGETPAAVTPTTGAGAEATQPIGPTPTTATDPAAPTATTGVALPTATPFTPPPASSNSDSTIWFIVGAVLILLGAGLVGFFVTRRKA